ncbi:MAG: hypothetical protein HYX76_09325, partial [Acidobacteria bacterium]|nr:hypothetical protein [Acidobacteriota bacterium]
MKRTVAILGVGLFMGAIALTYPLAREPGSALPGNLGDPLLNSWALAWGSERIADGFAGFWDAPVFFPHHDSLAFSESLAGVAVFVAPIQWVLGNPILTYNVAFLFSFVHFGLGVFLLTRSVAGRTDAAVIAAVAATFSPYRTASQITFLQMQIAGWIPLGLWALHRYFTTGSRRALLASTAAIVLQILTSLYFAYLLLVPLSVIAVHGLLGDRESRMRRLRDLSGGAVIAMAVVGSVAAVYYRVQQQHGLVWPLDEHRRYSADVLSYVHVRQGADTWIDLPQEATAVRALFPGTALLVLGILGSAVCCLRSERRTNTKAPGSGTRDSGSRNQGPGVRLGRIYALIGIVSLALSLGPQPSVAGHAFLPSGPYAWLMAVLPGLSGFRIPARFGIMVHLSLAVLAAIGAAWLLSRTKARSWRLTLCAGLVIVGLVDGYTGPVRLPRFDPRGRQASHDLYEWLKAHPGPAIVLPIADADAAVKALAGESLARVYHYG